MVKLHNCLVEITNKTQFPMTYVLDWYDSGRVADGFTWPPTINANDHQTVLSYERDGALAGCSGYVTYNMNDTEVTIAFSNPDIGSNKLGVGTGGKKVWDEMESHDYEDFTQTIVCDNGMILLCYCKCTGGTTNTCTINLTRIKK